MGWIAIILLAMLLLAGSWRFGRLDRAALQLVAAAIFVALAGYAWQGSPGLEGSPASASSRPAIPNTEFAELRGLFLGRFDTASRWLTIADHYHRAGKTEDAASIIRAGICAHPREPDLWVGLGNALVVHAGGSLTPAAELAFRRAVAIAPKNAGPRFFYGLALARRGDFREAERMWRDALANGAPDAEWRPMVEQRLAFLERLIAMAEAMEGQQPSP